MEDFSKTINASSEERQVSIVRKFPEAIKYIQNPSLKVQRTAVNNKLSVYIMVNISPNILEEFKTRIIKDLLRRMVYRMSQNNTDYGFIQDI